MKVALIEDRISRMEQFSPSDITKIPHLEIITDEDLKKGLADLDENKVDFLASYECILAHRSALTNIQREILKKHCTEKHYPLVLFSGGISASIYNDANFPFLHINSKDFYSENFTLFMADVNATGKANLLLLQFGKNWKLNLLLSLRNHVNYRLRLKTLKRIRDFQISTSIKKELITKFALPWLQNSDITEVSEEQVRTFYKKLSIFINDSL